MATSDTNAQDSADSDTPRRSVWRRYRWLVILVAGVVALPSLLTITKQQQAVIKLLHPELAAATQFQSATVHWWAPVEIRELRVADLGQPDAEADATLPAADAVPLLTAASVQTVQPLWKIVLAFGSRTEVIIHQPVINIRVHDGITNVEDTVAKLFGSSTTSASADAAMPLAVTIYDGHVRLQTRAAKASAAATYTSLSGINATWSTLNPRLKMPELQLVATVGEPEDLTSANSSPTSSGNGINPRVAASLDELAGDFPLIPFTQNQMDELRVKTVQPSIKVQISSSPKLPDVQNLLVEGRRLQLAEFEPLIQRWLPGTRCAGGVSLRLQAHLLDDGDGAGFAGRMQLLGEEIRWRNSAWAIGESLDLPSVTVQGAVALAKDGLLVNDLQIKSALLDLNGSGEVRIVATDPVQAIAAAASKADAETRQTAANAQAAAAGQVQLQGRVDLARLSQMLPQTLHVNQSVTAESGELRFSGRVQQQASVASAAELFAETTPGFRWQLLVESSPLQLRREGRPLVIDSPLRLETVGDLTTSSVQLRQALLKGAFGTLQCTPLTHSNPPVSQVSDSSPQQTISDGFQVSGTVNPDRLWQDLRNVIDIPRPGLTSDLTIDTKVWFRETGVTLGSLTLKSHEIEVSSPQLTIVPSAPVVQMFDGTLLVNGTAAAIRTLVAPWHTADWLASSSSVVARLDANPAQQITVQVAIQRSQVVRNASLYRTISANHTTAEAPLLEIDHGRLDASLMADPTSGLFRVEKGLIEIPGLQALVTGQLGVEADVLVVNLDADTQYNLEVLSRQLLADPSQQIMLRGTATDTFHFKGCPSLLTEADVSRHLSRLPNTQSRSAATSLLHPLEASGSVKWSGGRLYGLTLGPGAAIPTLKNGLLRTEPIQCTLGSGQVSFMPQWDLVSQRVQLAPGSRIENLQVTPELAREWLGYVAPMLADAASVQGVLSARLQQFDYDLNAIAGSTIQGELVLRDTVAAPGSSLSSLTQALALLNRDAGRLNERLELPDQTVPFQLTNGMIRHDGLQIQFGDYRMNSRGGVGLDRRVQLVLDVPLEKNVNDSSGRMIQIPITGTIDRPQLETQGLLQNLGRQQIQNQVDQQLNRGLNKLFDKLR